MDLESPTETVCPLHAAVGEAHTVEVNENRNGDPYFTCGRLKTTVNLHADDSEGFVREMIEVTDQTGILAEPDESDETDESSDEITTMADLIGNNE